MLQIASTHIQFHNTDYHTLTLHDALQGLRVHNCTCHTVKVLYFSLIVCLENCSSQQVAVLCRELKSILLHVGEISAEVDSTLTYRTSDL